MMIFNNKQIKHFIINNLRQVLISVFNLLFPILIVNKADKIFWGEFLEIYIYIPIISAVVHWGNRNYLLRKFSNHPKDIKINFSSSLGTRFYLFLIISLIIGYYFPIKTALLFNICQFGIFLSTSYETIAIYKGDYHLNLKIDLVSSLFLYIILLLYPFKLSILDLLAIYSVYLLAKGIAYAWKYKYFLELKFFSFKLNLLKVTFPLFCLSFFGFIGNRIDVYIFQKFATPSLAADYHILNSFIIFIMAFAGTILIPNTKILYRGSEVSINKLKKRITKIGLLFLLIILPFLGMFLFIVLKINLSYFAYLLILLGVLPTFICCVDIMILYKRNKESYILLVTVIITILNASLSFIFLLNGLKIEGVLLSSAIAQNFTILAFKSKVFIPK